MLHHSSRRATSFVVALGTLLSLVLVGLTPTGAQAAPTCQPGYPSSVATVTNVTLGYYVGRAGQRNTATVTVSSGAGSPAGFVTIRQRGFRATVGLSGGSASVRLPAPRKNHTYRVRARFSGQGCYKGSSGSASYTVFGSSNSGRPHFTKLSARNIERGHRARVSGRIVKASGRAATGRATVRLYFHGSLKATKHVHLHHGRFTARFGKLRQVGTYTVRASGAGASSSTTFRVHS